MRPPRKIEKEVPVDPPIDPGRQLVRTSLADAHSLGQRVADFFERLTWRTPIHDLRLKGRHPTKLVALPGDPLTGDVELGEGLLAGLLHWRGETKLVAEIDLRDRRASAVLWEHLHSFRWLRDLATVPDRPAATRAAEETMARWLVAVGDRTGDAAWAPALCGRRLLMWFAHGPLLLSSTDLIFRSSVLNAIARSARHLDRTADKADAGAPRIAAWSAVVAAGLLVPGAETRRAVGEAGLSRALAASVSADGGVVSRSGLAQIEAIELIAMLRAAYDARRLEAPAVIGETLTRMVPALLGIAMGDGGLASWQSAPPVPSAAVKRVIAAGGVQGRPLRQARDWGYQRMVAGRTLLVMDAAPPPLAPPPGGGCASTLAFELSDGEDRVVVNCGGAAIAPRYADALRTTAAHSTLTIDDSNSTAILADGSLGRGVVEVELSRQESEGGSRIEASHDGYARRHGFVHRRLLTLAGTGAEIRGEDSLLPSGRSGRGRQTPFALRFHLGPGIRAAATGDGTGAILRTPAGAIWQFRCRDGLTLEESLWIDAEGRAVATQQIVVAGTADAGGASIAWTMTRALTRTLEATGMSRKGAAP